MLAYLMQHDAPRADLAGRMDTICAQAGTPAWCTTAAAAVRSPDDGASILRKELDALRVAAPGAAIEAALWAAYLGDRDLALDTLEVATKSTPSPNPQILWYPLLGKVRKDPRFKQIVRDIGFVELWRTAGRWSDSCRPVGDDDFECQ